jgi:cell filamentation protein
MADDKAAHGYTYPNTSDDPDRKDVLRNKFGLRTHSELRVAEYRITNDRRIEIELGQGPNGKFDADHLSAIHRHLFSDIYDWAGHRRDERPIVDGRPVETIGPFRKEPTSFLHGSRIAMGLEEALRPIRDPDALNSLSSLEFAEVAGRVLADLNYVHPFREGNGRTQEAFIAELGRCHGHYVDFTVITKPRMVAASIATAKDPDDPTMRHLMGDSTEPARVAALKAAFAHLLAHGANPYEHDVRTARPGEAVTGTILGSDPHGVSLVTDRGIVVVAELDLPRRKVARDDEITVTARTELRRPAAKPVSADNYWSGVSSKGQGTRPSGPGAARNASVDPSTTYRPTRGPKPK